MATMSDPVGEKWWADRAKEEGDYPTQLDEGAADRCYNAGWSDMRAMAMTVCETAGRHDLAGYIRDLERPASGDK